MEEIVIPNLDDDDEDHFPLPSFTRPAFGSIGSTSSLPDIAASPEQISHRTNPSTENLPPSFNTPARPHLPKSSASYSPGFPTPPSYGDEPRLGKFSNGSSTSLTTSIGSSAPFPKKGSKASLTSLRNAFKSSAAVPPVPNLTTYPVLRNPFSRYNEPHSPSRPFASPHVPRKSTASSRSIGGRSATSQGSRQDDVPALPPIPARSTPSRVGRQGSDTSMFAFRRHGSIGLDGIEESTRTAGEEALAVVWREFRQGADAKVARICGRPLNTHPSLSAYLDTGIDPTFDMLMSSLANCARRYARKVADLLNGWCKTHCEGIGASEVRAHLDRSLGLQMRVEDAAAILGGRKSSAARFILNRALIELVRLVPKESMGEELGMILEQNAFNAYRSERLDEGLVPHRKAVSQLQVELLGCLSTNRFLTVSDRFIRELGKHASGQPTKESEMRIEHLLRGMRHLKLRVYPETELEMSAEFITQLAAFFQNVHGQSLKCAYAETFTSLLHPVVETATAEVNHPMWSKAIAVVLNRAIVMNQKPRYWSTAFPLVVVALGVSPRDVFMQHWQMCMDNVNPKVKDRRVTNCLLRILWIYLNRCSESATSTRKRLDPIIRLLVGCDEPVVQILHFIMTKQLDLGEDFVADYLKEDGPADRATALVRAIGYTLKALEEERPATWPRSADFTQNPDVLETSGEMIADPKSDVASFLKRANPAISNRLYSCDRAISHLLLSNDSVTLTGHASSVDAIDTIVRKHGDIYASYPSRYDPLLRLHAAILDIVPRTFHDQGSFPQVANILSRATFSADPVVCIKAGEAMQRYASNPLYCAILVNTYMQFVFDTRHVFRDTFIGSRLLESQFERVVTLWAALLESLATHNRAAESLEGVTPNLVDKVDGVALYLLCSSSIPLRRLASRVLSAARDLEGQRRPSAAFRYSRIQPEKAMTRVIQIYGMTLEESHVSKIRSLSWFTSSDRNRLDMHTERECMLQKIAESDNAKDGLLWLAILPHFIATISQQLPRPVQDLRSIINTTVLRVQGHVASLGSLSANRIAGRANSMRTSSDTGVLADHWRSYLSILTATMPAASIPQTPVQRTKEAVILTPETISTPALFHYLASILSWDDPRFKDAAVYALGAIDAEMLRPLTEILFGVVRRLADAKANPRDRKTANGPLWTSIAHVFRLISPLLSDAGAHPGNLSSMIGFVKLTYSLLSDRTVREDFDLQSLRRSFCIVVDNLTQALGKLDSSDRFFGKELRGAIFKLCYEWCHVGRRPDVAKARESQTLQAAAEGYRGERDRAQYLDDLQAKTKLLSAAAAEAMAGLCQGKLVSTETTPAAQSSDHIVEPLTVLRWIRGMFSSSSHHETARKALFSLLKHNWQCSQLLDEVLHQSFGEGEQFSLDSSFFGVVANVISDSLIELPTEQLCCLVLSKLGHPVLDIRLRAFQLAVALDPETDISFLPAVGSSAPNVYRQAQKGISVRLAELYADHAVAYLSESTIRLSQLEAPRRQATLAVLPAWIGMIELDESSAMPNLIYLAIRFADDHLDDVRDILLAFGATTSLVKFLFDQGGRRKSPEFVAHAQRIIACLAQGDDNLFDEICSFVEPSAMASITDEPPEAGSLIDALISAPRSQTFSTGQLALLFAGELLPFKSDIDKLPTLLHAAVIHADHAGSDLREQCQSVLFQVLRAWVAASGGSEQHLATLHRTPFWRAEDDGAKSAFLAPPKMTTLVLRILAILTPLQPRIRQIWGELALGWATSCPIRHLACRSFQLFRILSPKVSSRMISDTLARLSSTIASSSPEIQAFNLEVLRTFAAIVQDTDLGAHPQIFWCTVACLYTPYEEEFIDVIELFSHVLDKTNLSDPTVIQHLLSSRPPEWVGPSPHLQTLLLPGLRSSKTSMLTFDLVRRLASCAASDLIDPPEERLLHGFVAALPWMLQSTDLGEPNEDLTMMALDLASLAEESNPSLGRLLTSFAHARFRAKDDFIRQAASLLRDYLKSHALDIVVVLLGFVLNTHDWMREKAMQVLKLVFMSPEARAQIQQYGNELLQPLLRLVSTKHSAQALDVLDMPVISDAPVTGDIYGTISPSGWSVPGAKEQSLLTRENVTAVFNTCAQETRAASAHFSVVQFADLRKFNPSQLSFDIPSPPALDNASMGDLVGALHSLNQFFDDGLEPIVPENESRLRNGRKSISSPIREKYHKPSHSIASSSVSSIDLPNQPFYGLKHRHQVSYSSATTDGEYVEEKSGLFNLDDANASIHSGLSEAGNQTTPVMKRLAQRDQTSSPIGRRD